MQGITINQLRQRKDWHEFFHLPWYIYAKDPLWVPPLLYDLKRQLNETKNPFFLDAEVRYWIAKDGGGKCVGRIAAIVNHQHNRYYRDKVGFFGYFECINDTTVANMLLSTASCWLMEKGMDTLRGPVNLSLTNETGLLIDGFERSPVLQMSYNPPYYRSLLEQFGCVKEHDLLAFYIDDAVHRNQAVMQRLERLSLLVSQKEHIHYRYFDTGNFNKELEKIRLLFNGYMKDNWGFLPMEESEIDFMATSLKPVLIPELAIFAEVNGEAVGFSLSLPDFNQVLKRMNGRLFPTGIFKYLLYKNKITDIRVLLMGITKPYRRKGIESMFYYKTITEGVKRHFTGAELSWLSEDNTILIRELERLGASLYKRYRVYGKPLAGQAAIII